MASITGLPYVPNYGNIKSSASEEISLLGKGLALALAAGIAGSGVLFSQSKLGNIYENMISASQFSPQEQLEDNKTSYNFLGVDISFLDDETLRLTRGDKYATENYGDFVSNRLLPASEKNCPTSSDRNGIENLLIDSRIVHGNKRATQDLAAFNYNTRECNL